MKTREDASIIDALYRISSLVGQTEEPGEALPLIIAEIIRMTGAHSASIALINPDTNCLEIEVFEGLPNQTGNLQLQLGEGVTGWVALHGKPLVVDDVRQDPRYYNLKESIRSEMAVPMEVEGIIIGVINVDSEETGAFTEQDLKVLSLLTNETSKVISRLWLINQLKSQATQLESLVGMGRQLVTSRDLSGLLKQLTRQARNLMGCKLCALYMLDRESGMLTLRSLSGLPPEKLNRNEHLALEESSVGVAIQRRKQVEVLDLARTEEHHLTDLVQEEGLASLLATPLLYADEAIGVLNVYTDTRHRFNNDEKKILATLAGLGAVAIENSRLYARVFASEESLRKNEKLTTLGLLAAEIAHEIRNPLTVIKLLFESLTLDVAEDDARQQDITVIGEQLRHLEEIVENVLGFGRNSGELNAADIITETLQLVRLKGEQAGVTLSFEPPAERIDAECNKGQLQQVMLNLTLNAIEAMPAGGEVVITLRGDGKRAVVTISDTGSGVPADIRERIFDSFLTARKGGTGLGLALVKRILREHRGDIELVDTGPQGTTFAFWLPRHDGD